MDLLSHLNGVPAAFTLRQLQAPSLQPWPGAVRAPALRPVQVVLVAGDAHVRKAVGRELAADARTELIAVAFTLHEGLRLAALGELDVLMVDLDLADGSGLELMAHVKGLRPSAGTIVMARADDEEAALRAFELGAAGWLVIRDWSGSYALLVLNVAQGGAALSPALARRLMRRPAPSGALRCTPLLATLTEREREVLAQVAGGLSSKEIARRLAISGDTVNAHVKSIYRKLQVHSRAQAVRMASQAGIF